MDSMIYTSSVLTLKDVIGAIAVLLTFVGYVPYIRDTISGKTKPHVYTWFLWAFVTAIAFALQVSESAGPGSLVTLAASIVCFVIFALSYRQGTKDIVKTDTVFFILGIIALILWLFAKQPAMSVIIVSIIDMLAFGPTIRKSWNKPYTETLVSYQINTLRFALALFALQRYTIVTSLYPLTWVVANGFFSLFLIWRRKTIKS